MKNHQRLGCDRGKRMILFFVRFLWEAFRFVHFAFRWDPRSDASSGRTKLFAVWSSTLPNRHKYTLCKIYNRWQLSEPGDRLHYTRHWLICQHHCIWERLEQAEAMWRHCLLNDGNFCLRRNNGVNGLQSKHKIN